MIGTESLWNAALLQKKVPDKESDCYQLLSSNIDTVNIHTFHSQLFLSAVLYDTAFDVEVKETAEQIWYKAHGFTDTLNISFSKYLHLVTDYKLIGCFEVMLSSIPPIVYREVINGCMEHVYLSTETLYSLYPALMTSELRQLKLGTSANIYLDGCMSLILNKFEYIKLDGERHLCCFDALTINKIVTVCFAVMKLITFRGSCEVLSEQDGFCFIERSCCQSLLDMTDDELAFLHDELGLTCCKFRTCSESDLKKLVVNCPKFYDDCLLFFRELVSMEKLEYLVNLFTYSTYLFCSPNAKMYDAEYITFLGGLRNCVTSETESLRIFKAINVWPEKSSWSDLVDHCRYNVHMSDKSFEVMIYRMKNNETKLREVLTLLPNVSPESVSLFLRKIFIRNESNISDDLLSEVIEGVYKDLKIRDLKSLRTIAKDVYYTCQNKINLEDITDKLNYLKLDYNNITKLVNQLANLNNTTSKDKLVHNIVLTLIFYPEAVILELFHQGSINKSISLIVASLLSENTSFVMKIGQSVPPLPFKALLKSFITLSSGKSVKVFHQFILLIVRNNLITEEMILRWLILPNLSSRANLLVTLQFSALFVKTYNFTYVYHIALIWSETCDDEVVRVLDEIIFNTSQDLQSISQGELSYLCGLLQEIGWETAVRFFQFFVSSSCELALPSFYGTTELRVSHSLFRFDGPLCDLLQYEFVLKVIMNCPESNDTLMVTYDGDDDDLSYNMMSDMAKLNIRSEYEWNNLYCYLQDIVCRPVFNLPPFNTHPELYNVYNELSAELIEVGLDPEKYLHTDQLEEEDRCEESALDSSSLSLCIMYSILIYKRENEREENEQEKEEVSSLLRWWGSHCYNKSPDDMPKNTLQTFIYCCLILRSFPSHQSTEITLLDVLNSVVRAGPLREVERGVLLLPRNIRGTVSQKISQVRL